MWQEKKMTIDQILNEMAKCVHRRIATSLSELRLQAQIIARATTIDDISEDTKAFVHKTFQRIQANEPLRPPHGEKFPFELFNVYEDYPEPYKTAITGTACQRCFGIPSAEVLNRANSEWQFQMKCVKADDDAFRHWGDPRRCVKARMKAHPLSKNSKRKTQKPAAGVPRSEDSCQDPRNH
jgi:hypothetical protein